MTYGCRDRAPYKPIVAYGMDSQTGETIRIELPHRLSTECQYAEFDQYDDKGCEGCSHKSAAMKRKFFRDYQRE